MRMFLALIVALFGLSTEVGATGDTYSTHPRVVNLGDSGTDGTRWFEESVHVMTAPVIAREIKGRKGLSDFDKYCIAWYHQQTHIHAEMPNGYKLKPYERGYLYDNWIERPGYRECRGVMGVLNGERPIIGGFESWR